MKRIQIAQAEGLDWKDELRTYVTVYRSIEHLTKGKSPAELLLIERFRESCQISQQHAKISKYATGMQNKKQKQRDMQMSFGVHGVYSKVNVGDTVLVRQEKVDKFTTPFNPVPHQVMSKAVNQVIVESPTGARYTRNTPYVKRFNTNETTDGETEREQSCQNTRICCPLRICIPKRIGQTYQHRIDLNELDDYL